MQDCLFCKIAAGDIPSNKLYEDETLLAFYDIDPQAPAHFLVIPKRHISSAAALTEEDAALLGHVFAVIAKLCKELGVIRAGTGLSPMWGRTAARAYRTCISTFWPNAAWPGRRADAPTGRGIQRKRRTRWLKRIRCMWRG